MIRTILMLTLWAIMGPFAAIIGFIAAFLMGDIRLLYFLFTRGAWIGVRIAGIRFETVGLNHFDHSRSYIFMTKPLVEPRSADSGRSHPAQNI